MPCLLYFTSDGIKGVASRQAQAFAVFGDAKSDWLIATRPKVIPGLQTSVSILDVITGIFRLQLLLHNLRRQLMTSH